MDNYVSKSEFQEQMKTLQNFLLGKINAQQETIENLTKMNRIQTETINHLIDEIKEIKTDLEYIKDDHS